MQEETDGDPRCASLPGPGGRRAPGAGRESGDTERSQSARLKLCVSWPRPPSPGSLTCAGPAALAVRQWPRNPQGLGCRISLLVQRHQRCLWHLLAPPWHAIGPVPAVGLRQPCDGANGLRRRARLDRPDLASCLLADQADLGAAGLTLDPVGPLGRFGRKPACLHLGPAVDGSWLRGPFDARAQPPRPPQDKDAERRRRTRQAGPPEQPGRRKKRKRFRLILPEN